MPDFNITVPGSGSFKVTAPDADTAYSSLMDHLGSAGPQATPAPGPGPAAAAPANGPYTDPVTGEVHNVVAGDQMRQGNDWTQADVDSRTAFLRANPQGKSVAGGILGHAPPSGAGQSLTTASSPEDLAAAARDPGFDARVLGAAPDGQRRIAATLLGQQRAGGDSALGVGIRKGADTVALGIPSALEAAQSPLGYETERAIQRAEYDKNAADHPIANAVGTGAGALAQAAIPGVGALAATPGRAALSNAGLSAASDAIENDRDLKTLQGWKDVGTAALTGGAAGFAGAQLLGAGDKVAAQAEAERARLADLGLGPRADRVLRGALDDAGELGQPGIDRVQAAGPGAMAADAGPGAQNMLDLATQRGINLRQSNQAIGQRAAEAGQDINQSLDVTLGPGMGRYTGAQGIREATAPARGAAYEAAYNTPVNYAHPAGQEIEQLLQRVPRSALDQANALMHVEGQQSRQILLRLGPNGEFQGMQHLPDTRQLDYITRGLNQVAESSEGRGALGGQTPYGKAVGDLSQEIRSRLKSINEPYARALETAADPIRRIQMLRLSDRVMTMPRDELAYELQHATDPERLTLMQGMRQKIDDNLARVHAVITDHNVDAREAMQAVRLMSSRDFADKVAMIAGKGAADDLQQAVQQASYALQLRASQVRNSATYARQAGAERLDSEMHPGVAGALGGAIGEAVPAAILHPAAGAGIAGMKIVHALLEHLPDRTKAAQNLALKQISSALVNNRGADAERFLQRLATPAQLPPGVAAPIGSAATRQLIQSLLARGAVAETNQR